MIQYIKDPRGLRNKNPLNIRYDGTNWQGLSTPPNDGQFCVFKDFDYGYRAALKVLNTYYRKHNLRTLRDIIARWAPAADGNDPKKYAAFVAGYCGTKASHYLPDPSIDKAGWVNILIGMTFVECGTNINEQIMRAAANEAWLLLYEDIN